MTLPQSMEELIELQPGDPAFARNGHCHVYTTRPWRMLAGRREDIARDMMQ